MAGQLRVDEITDEAGTGSPSFPFGLPVGYAAGGTAPAAGSFTEVPSNVLEVGDPIRSNDIIAIKDNTLFLFDASFGFPIIDQQRFDASGTWTKPNISTPEAATVVAVLVGGGGAGARSNRLTGNSGVSAAGGGGTGGIALSTMFFNDSSTATVTIGAAGLGSSGGPGTVADGGNGGGSTIVMTNGTLTSNGGGGGQFTADGPSGISGGAGGRFGNISGTNLWQNPINFGKNGRDAGSGAGIRFEGALNPGGTSPVPTFSGGGAFGATSSTTFSQNSTGGPAFVLSELNNEPFMGAGGTGSNTTASNAGAMSGGGGGAAAANTGTTVSGNGASGGALIFVVRGIISQQQFLDKYLQIP